MIQCIDKYLCNGIWRFLDPIANYAFVVSNPNNGVLRRIKVRMDNKSEY